MDDVVLLSRLQFAVAVLFHFIFVPLTLGLSVLLAWMETRYVTTGDEVYKRMAKFWGKLFLINFTLGVVTGITLEFQFGTNWSRYSTYVGDIFGSLLAIEATVAFFLESTFVAVWAFGWNRLGKKTHCFAIWMVAIASNCSALWIILANGWMQHPVGYVIRNGRAELQDFFAVLTNPYAWGQYAHTILSAWMLASFFVLGISAWHLARKSNGDFFRRCFRMAAPFALICALLTALTGHQQGMAVAKYQPVKLSAMEAQWETQKHVPVHLLQIPDRANKMNSLEALSVPGLMSWMAYGDVNAEIKGLKAFPETDWPPVNTTFWSFRVMVALGVIFILLAGVAFLQRNKEEIGPGIARALVWAIPLPYLGLAFGWTVAEVGRQPWIVHGLMRTTDAVSPVPAGNVVLSLIAFIVVYSLLGLIDIYLLRKYACQGPGR
ncbi:MAG: cytochrome ubiquinol oxidase subunit I [Betaproteobacteria bacterium]|nr:cytochrome ubiquinol oxidase subunit I [Betaproteobacteria bacterium]